MTDLTTLPLTSDDAAPVNPFAAAMFAEHFEQRRLDFLGRPIDGPAPRDVRSTMDAASIANTRAWLDARQDDKGEPGGIYVPPVVHDREATPEEQAWLDAHPEYAIKEGEGQSYSFVPFPSTVSKEPASTTMKTEPQTNDTPARHIGDEPIPGPRPTGREQAWKDTCTQVRLFWRKSLGTSEGYDLFLGRNWVHFPGPEWRIEEALNPPLTQEAERREVNWDIEWNAPGGRASLINLEVKDVAPKSKIEQQIDEQHAEAVASRPDSEWETFDKEPETPADQTPKPLYLGHTAVPDEAIHAIPNHIKRELALAPEKVGLHVRNALGTATPDYIGKHGVQAAWDKALDYVAKVKASQNGKDTPPEPQNGRAPETGVTSQADPVSPQEAPAKPQEVASTKPTDKPVETVSGEIMPDPLPPATDEPSKEIILFDARRAISRAEAAKAVVDRMYAGGVLVKDVDYGPVPGTEKPTLLKPGAEKLLTAFHLYDQFKPVEVVREWNNGFFFYEYECTLYDRETGKAIGSGIGSCNSMEKKYRYRWVTEDRVPRHMNKADLPSKGGKVSEPEFAIEKGETTGKYGKPAAYWQQFRDAIANGTAVAGSRDTKNGKPMKTWEIDTTMYGIPNEDIFDQVNTISKMAQKRALVAAALNATGASAVFTQDMEDFADFGVFDAA